MMMLSKSVYVSKIIILVLACTSFSVVAFQGASVVTPSSCLNQQHRQQYVPANQQNKNSRRVTRTSLQAVIDIGSEAAFDKTVKNAGDSLVIVDYSTTWCGPCKVIAPKFEELSDKYPNAVFLKVIGDASPDASKLMKREGVRSVPSFHYFVKGEKVDVINGANAEAIEAAITKHVHENA